MRIHFNIEYRTRWGEDLRVQLWMVDKRGQKTAVKELPLSTQDGKMWDGEMMLEEQQKRMHGIEYKYAMYRDGKLVWTEWEVAPHKVKFDGVTNSYVLSDKWRPIPEDQPLFSSAYTECVGAVPDGCDAIDTLFSSTLQLRVVEPRLKKGEWLAVCGNTPQ